MQQEFGVRPCQAPCAKHLPRVHVSYCLLHGCQALHELGILSIVDLHQDSYSRFLNKGCGDGFPK